MSNDQPDLFGTLDGVCSTTPFPEAAKPSEPLPRPPEPLVLPFPLAARVGKVRDVARKLGATTTARHASHYREQVTEALQVHMRAKHVPNERHAAELAAFWRAVDLDVLRRAGQKGVGV